MSSPSSPFQPGAAAVEAAVSVAAAAPVPSESRFESLSQQSLQEQRDIEARDSMPFEIYRQQYVSPERLGLTRAAVAPALAAV